MEKWVSSAQTKAPVSLLLLYLFAFIHCL